MDKKLKMLITIGIILIILIGGLIWLDYKKSEDEKFLGSLKGEIIYLKNDANNVSNLYKISANGKDKKLIYHNTDSKNPSIYSTCWSKDGSKIYFSAKKDGRWSLFSINPDGTGLSFIEYSGDEPKLSADCKINDSEGIFAMYGNLYYTDAENKTIQVFDWSSHHLYHSEFNTGAGYGHDLSPDAWSPDKKFIAFESCGFFEGCNIMIANKEGTKVVKLTSGADFDWKY